MSNCRCVCGLRVLASLSIYLTLAWVLQAEKPPRRTSSAPNARLADLEVHTVQGIGAGQGVSLHQDKLYFYGDVRDDGRPIGGVIREYSLDMKPTGRTIRLTANGKPVITHPTGLTWHDKLGCFVGDTVDGVANIYKIDWKRALADGNLDHALLARVQDDAAVNGCRPEFVTVGGRTLLATADYGNEDPAIRLYDVERMLRHKRTSDDGVIVHAIRAGPYNQNLYWDAPRRQLVCIQNVAGGIGWRLDRIQLDAAVRKGNVDAQGARSRQQTFARASELEGFRPLADGRDIFVTASERNNAMLGRIETIALTRPALSP